MELISTQKERYEKSAGKPASHHNVFLTVCVYDLNRGSTLCAVSWDVQTAALLMSGILACTSLGVCGS